uniref:Putative cation/H(+) antiporter 15-like isoform X1 n=1 Tax=Davidia involucrata TaxID=16924 RepID=A0A5B7BES5_DAVIN
MREQDIYIMGSGLLSSDDPTQSKVHEQVVDILSYVCHHVSQINSRGMWFGDNPLDFSLPSLMFQLSLITIVTRCIYFILKRFGQPLIVSQILGGIILGPSILGQNSVFAAYVFPTKSRNVLETLSVFGFMLFIFLIGVKVDPRMVSRSGKKALAIGILCSLVPYGVASFVAYLLSHFLSLDHDISSVLSSVVAMQSMTAFPVIACFLAELEILNSEIGRLASSSSFICDVCNWSIMSIKFAVKLAMDKPLTMSIGSFLSAAIFVVVIVLGFRPAAFWIIRNTPEGKPVKDIYIFAVFVALMGGGFIGEAIGMSGIFAAIVIGMVIPDGPPLGAALVERLDCFVSSVLMPLFFATCGLHMDVFAIQKLKNVGVLQLIVLVAFLGKIMGTMLPPLFCRMPFRDALSLALIMNSKGVVELAILTKWKQSRELNDECFAILIISLVAITGVISPIVKLLYDPSKRFIAYKRRTILHSRRNEELRILACVHSSDNVRAIMTLLQVSNPTKDNPIDLVVLHLVKLMGRASSLLIAHRQREKPSPNPSQSERIFNAFKKLEQQNHGLIMVHCYKGISPYATMHNDVCSLALEKRTILIIVPFHKQWTYGEGVETSYAYRHLNKNVLAKAPCSVGILIDRTANRKMSRYAVSELPLYRVAVLFFGGADDREALAYARRMSEHPNVTIELIRFTSSNSNAIVGGTARSKTLDADILCDFKHNSQVSYQEVVVAEGMGVVAVTRSIANACDLVMVGRRHSESPIMFQLTKWNACGELGAVGEILSASDFKGGASVLVVQQQTRLWGLQDPEDSTHLRKISL